MQDPDRQQDGQQNMDGMSGGMRMSKEDMQRQHDQTLWVHFAVMALGLLLVSSPPTFGYGDSLMVWNDVACGLALLVLGFASVSPERAVVRWATCAIGIWLLFAPLVFWSSDPEAFLVDTLVGALAIAFSILVPGMPGMRMMDGPDLPPGWTYNPSSWVQRAPVITLALVSFFISRYLAAYQLGYIDSIWDPVFGEGTRQVLESDVSRAWPVSDAGFGAVSYMIEALSGFMGMRNRWRTMPWMVLMFGVLVIPLGITSIVLVILQPVMVGEWCFFCLLTAAFMLLMIPLAVDEIVAMFQFMGRIRADGKPFWVNFWRGGTIETNAGSAADSTTFHAPAREIGLAMVRGVNVPWNLGLAAAIGLWLMASPAVFGTTGWAADSNDLFGPLITVVAVCAWGEVIRPLRYLNVALGTWIIVAPWLLSGASMSATANNGVMGLALIVLSLPRGTISQRYAGWREKAMV